MAIGDIPELLLLSDIERLSADYALSFGALPLNLSDWDPSADVIGDLQPLLPATPFDRWIEYNFSYSLDERSALLARFGFDAVDRGCLVLHSGSSAIVSAANWLRMRGCERVVVLGPRYFTVPHALSALGIGVTLEHLRRTESGFLVPALDPASFGRRTALWITNPVYCTSVDYDPSQITELAKWAGAHGVPVVVDECLAEQGRYIGSLVSNHAETLCIYAPHKSICINGVKFSALVFPRSEQDYFDAWADVWNGCVPWSSVVAVRHFLSANFERYRSAFRNCVHAQHKFVKEILSHSISLSIDNQADGYLVSVYSSRHPYLAGADTEFLRAAIWATGGTFISGHRNEMDPRAGLSFRINLAALDSARRGTFHRLCAWLDNGVRH